MKYALIAAAVAALSLGSLAHAQQTDKEAARAARKAAGTEAAQHPDRYGERMPSQGPQAKATPEQKVAARAERRAEGAEAATHVYPQADYVAPESGPKVPRAERKVANKERRAVNSAANKAGDLKGYGEAGKP